MMFRRHFVHRIAALGAVGLTARASNTEDSKPLDTRNVVFDVRGFTCVTCAIGLEVVLRQQKGVAHAKASYPEQKVTIGFDTSLTSIETLAKFINDTTGFTVSLAAS